MSSSSTILRQANIITESRYDMSALEKNIVYMLMSLVREGDEPEKSYVIEIKDLEEKLGEELSKEELRKATTSLLTQSYKIKKGNNLLVIGLIGFAHYDASKGVFRVKISRKILPYLLALKKNFTEFQLDVALSMRSKYSKRIYEMLSQHKKEEFWQVEVEELKERLLFLEDNYENFNAFKNQVLNVAKREIAKHTDIMFTYEAKKTGRKYTHLHFKISNKPRQLELFDAKKKIIESSMTEPYFRLKRIFESLQEQLLVLFLFCALFVRRKIQNALIR